ncbi:S8/S53 family peptidase [Mesorhizobium sp. B2-4-4]|uniref:S8/S53 family peptidase n=1 Tax=Mesorhizobium sp. B2-4-4 TaxID=2589945 RepID=UPI0015E43F67|nr:S8/S53 family peptidase [Mesorhizobium sp. B2-4-4]
MTQRFKTVLAACVSIAAASWLVNGSSVQALETGVNTSPMELAEGDLSGRTVVQLRGRNVVDDWVALVRRLQEGGNINYIEVLPPAGGGLCQVYMDQLRLPGCSTSVLALAASLNPGMSDGLRADDKVKVPVLRLHPSQWSTVLDLGVPEDAAQLSELDTRWKDEILRRQEHDDLVRLSLRSYDVYLPEEKGNDDTGSAAKGKRPLYKSPQYDKSAKDVIIQKNVISPAGNILKNLFSVPSEHFTTCSKSDAAPQQAASYLDLLGSDGLPACAHHCTGNCPEINLFDTKVFRHPDIANAIVDNGGVSGEAKPADTKPLCPETSFKLNEHHGTMMASIMVSQNNGSSPFVGIAPAAHLRSFIAAELSQKRWSTILTERADQVWDTPQIFVFAGQFEYPDYLIDNGSLKDDDDRLGHPDVVRAIQDNKLLWVTAAGQNDNANGHQLSPTRPESPMNLGDQRTVIVVTSCEICVGKEARLWANANYSKPMYGLVNLAAPGGSPGDPIPTAVDQYHYSAAWGTSEATAFVGGVAAGMLSCFPDRFKNDGRWIKTRLQVTADPMPDQLDAQKVTGGIVNVKRAFLDPDRNWLDRGSGFEEVDEVKWCKDTLELKAADSGDLVGRVDVKHVGSILRFHDTAQMTAQWQIADAEPSTAKVKWTGPGAWSDDLPLLSFKTAGSGEQLATGAQIFSFVPKAKFIDIGVKSCQ